MGRPAKYDETELVDNATALFWREGAEVVSIRDLEQALDLRAPSLYRRFGTGNGLLVRCIDHYVDQVIGGRIRYFLESADDALAGLRTFFVSVLDTHPDEPQPRGCLLTNTAGTSAMDDEAIRAAVGRGLAMIETAFASQIDRARQAGQLDPAADPTALAKALLLAFQGLLVLSQNDVGALGGYIDTVFDLLAP